MRMRMISTRYAQTLSIAATDTALFGISIPSGTIVNEIRARVRMIGIDHTLAFNNIVAYAVAMYVLPVLDPDLADTYDDIWDALVHKDADVEAGGLELDAAGLDTINFWEPGEFDMSNIYEVGLRPQKLFGRYKFMTANDALMLVHNTESPFTIIWLAGDVFEIRVKRRFYVSQPSVIVCAVATPATTDTVTTQPTAFAENKWGQIKYMRAVLERSLINAIGLTETGAETPWVEASALLSEHISPDVVEKTSGAFKASTFSILTEAAIDHSVEGEIGDMVLQTERRSI